MTSLRPTRIWTGHHGAPNTRRLHTRWQTLRSVSRESTVRAIEGATIGLALWCALSSLAILPGIWSDTPGVGLLGIGGLVLGTAGRRRLLFGALLCATAVVAIVTLSPLCDAIAQSWVRRDVFPRSGVSAAVILSAGVNPDTTVSGEALDHLLTGMQLLHNHDAPLLVMTITHVRFPTGGVSSDVDQRRLMALLGSSANWLTVPAGGSTRGEALASAALLLPRGIRHIAVVASPMHTPRACAVFEAVGFDVTCVPARMRGAGGIPVTPGPAQRLVIFGQLVYELSALAEYRLHGWVPQLGRESLRAAATR